MEKLVSKEVNRYFIAVLPPVDISTEVRAIQSDLSEQYQTKAALRSPPHLTLHMPFDWKARKESELITALAGWTSGIRPFEVVLKDFGAFPPRVIYLNVARTAGLLKCQQELSRFCRIRLNLFNATRLDQPYHPHLTLAFRDLKKQEFVNAWQVWEQRQFEAQFVAGNIHLLRHDGAVWKAHHAFDLNPTSID